MKRINKIIDISGYGHSGKGILTDFFKEFDNITVHEYLFEFNLIRIQGGLIDLKHNLVDNWSPIRSDAAIRRFRNIVKRLGTKATIYDFKSLGVSTGNNYNSFFNDKFIKISEDYINKLILTKGKKVWHYRKVDESNLTTFYSRIRRKIFNNSTDEYNFSIVQNNDFFEITRSYLNNLFSNYINNNHEISVTNNMIEPYNPSYSLDFFYDAKSIIIQRDPRDIYASLYVNSKNKFLPDYLKKTQLWKEKESFLLAYDIDKYICQQKNLFNNSIQSKDCNKVLRLRFEDVILNYNSLKNKILNFVGISKKNHKKPFAFFDPNKSKKNIGLWKLMKNDKNILKIKSELPDLCYENN